MIRNIEVEKRIRERKENDIKLATNSYGGMGMDGITGNYKTMIMEEVNYMKSHPEIYNKKVILIDPSMYLIKLN